ncbi:VanZ family protein [Corynebacterium sp. 21KM1197]|uniref:VanZ family protein n=1 Tax=Corynebacterium sp. 21KM1197 TaxID=2989734 RepID=UPI0029CA84C8|nr:VanZ family protein [Corynebacterium sp. 21KM1197]WPF68618.1 VanZ family protein [Corynebacterium sp. 21KM1197]
MLSRPIPLRRGMYGLLCALYIVILLAVTLLKGWLSIDAVWDVEAQQQRSLDFVLFDGFSHPSVWWAPWLNTVGNVLLFIPLGALVAHYWRGRRPLWRAGIIGLLTSLTIEVTQYIAAVGYSDVDDLLCNTLGAVLGAVFYRQGSRAAR